MNSIDLFMLPQILCARARLVLACTLGLAGIVALLYLVVPERYRATASVVIDNRGLSRSLGAPAAPNVAYGTMVATQVNIVASEAVAKRVVSTLHLADDPRLRAQWQSRTEGRVDQVSWLAAYLLRNLTVGRAANESTVINITYSDRDPDRAARVANAFARSYLDVALDLSVSPSRLSAQFFREQTRESRAALAEAQTRLSDYERRNGIINGDERLDLETAQLNELAVALTNARARSIEARSRGDQPERSASAEVLQSPVVASLATEVARTEARFKELSSHLGPNHPLYRATEQQLTELRSRLSEAQSKAREAVSTTARASSQGQAQLERELNAQRARVLALKQGRSQLVLLQRDVDAAQKNYEQALQRLSQSSQQSQSTFDDVSLLTPADVPFQSIHPKPALAIPFAALLGFLLATAIALGLEYRSPRLFTAQDLVGAFGVPVLAAVVRFRPARSSPRIAGRPLSIPFNADRAAS